MKKKERNKLDKQWKEEVHTAWDHRCAVCGKTDVVLNAHHIISRQLKEFRHDKMNGILVCSNCHVFSPYISCHKGSLLFFDWLVTKYPQIHIYLLNKIRDASSAKNMRYY